jgi:hypothetical protein
MKNALLRAREPWCLENGKPTVLRAQVCAIQSTTKTGAAAPMGKSREETRCAQRCVPIFKKLPGGNSPIFALQHAG